MANVTMQKFGYPDSLLRDFEHWVVLLRPGQVTLGSLVLAAKSDATAFGSLPPEAHAELSVITREIEATLKAAIDYERINYLMLMMVDRDVHFHVLPRYEGERSFAELVFPDRGWPGAPQLSPAVDLAPPAAKALTDHLRALWPAG